MPGTHFFRLTGHGDLLQNQLREAGLDTFLDPQTLILKHHDRGKDELVHCALKDFVAQELPFTKFARNSAFYYTVLLPSTSTKRLKKTFVPAR